MTDRELRRAIVRMDGRACGSLQELEGGGTRYQYEPAWLSRTDAIPVSLTLPLRTEPFDSPSLHPFFANLLPEGWLLEISLARLKIARDDGFGLLLSTCADCMGAVEVVPEAEL